MTTPTPTPQPPIVTTITDKTGHTFELVNRQRPRSETWYGSARLLGACLRQTNAS